MSLKLSDDGNNLNTGSDFQGNLGVDGPFDEFRHFPF